MLAAHRVLWEHCQGWDDRVRRWVARIPGVKFPIVSSEEHERAARLARDLLADREAA